jgi:hypothetical protein
VLRSSLPAVNGARSAVDCTGDSPQRHRELESFLLGVTENTLFGGSGTGRVFRVATHPCSSSYHDGDRTTKRAQTRTSRPTNLLLPCRSWCSPCLCGEIFFLWIRELFFAMPKVMSKRLTPNRNNSVTTVPFLRASSALIIHQIKPSWPGLTRIAHKPGKQPNILFQSLKSNFPSGAAS